MQRSTDMRALRTKERLLTLGFVLTALPLGAAGATLLFAGWLATGLLAVTPLVVPVLAGFRAAAGLLARGEAAIARALLGVEVEPRTRSAGPGGYWQSARNVLADRAFWKQQSYLLLRCVLGWPLAIGELTLIVAGLGALTEPIYYRWGGQAIGSWHVDTLGRALLFVPPGIIALMVAFALLRPLGFVSRSLAQGLLGEAGAAAAAAPRRRGDGAGVLAICAALYLGANVVETAIWAASSRGYYWPEWTLLVFGVPLAVAAWVMLLLDRPSIPRRLHVSTALAVHAGAAFGAAGFFTLIWAFTSHRTFWPVWPIIVVATAVLAHAVVSLAQSIRNGGLTERIAVLETTRAGAVDQQEAELRRIERDLHDGAQARLVALGMSIGLAEQKLRSDPGAAEVLLAEARHGAREALEELRDLARGIHPPVLADRGLEAAVRALTDRSPLQATVSVDLGERPAAAVEGAAYFVVAEALANVGKHAGAEHVDVAIRRERGTLVVEIADDGRGGADSTGTGLTGLARRVQALDGTLEVTSPPGGPTTLRVVMPCES